MDDIAAQLAARDRLRRHLEAKKTYSQRLREMAELQAATWQRLRQSPEGYAHFLRRNFKARSIPAPAPPNASDPHAH